MLRTVILGATTPLGATFARQVIERGDRVALVGSQPGRIPLFADLATAHPDRVTLHTDARRPIEATAAAAVEAVGGAVDRLILAGWDDAAGPSISEREANRTLALLDAGALLSHLDHNAVQPLLQLRAFRTALRHGIAPRAMAITSWLGGFTDHGDGGHYGAAMAAAALQMAMRAVAFDLEPDGILVLTGYPGLYRQALHAPAIQPTADEVTAGLLAVLERADDAMRGHIVDWKGAPRAW